MNRQVNPSLRRMVALGALLLLAATASGCGVGLPTQPDLDSGAVNERDAGAAGAGEPGGPLELGDPSGGGGSGEAGPAPTDWEIVPVSGPGNSDWGHSHKRPKKDRG